MGTRSGRKVWRERGAPERAAGRSAAFARTHVERKRWAKVRSAGGGGKKENGTRRGKNGSPRERGRSASLASSILEVFTHHFPARSLEQLSSPGRCSQLKLLVEQYSSHMPTKQSGVPHPAEHSPQSSKFLSYVAHSK